MLLKGSRFLLTDLSLIFDRTVEVKTLSLRDVAPSLYIKGHSISVSSVLFGMSSLFTLLETKLFISKKTWNAISNKWEVKIRNIAKYSYAED